MLRILFVCSKHRIMYIKELQNCQVELRFSTRACVNKLDNDVFGLFYY